MEKLRRLELVLAVGVTALAIYLHAHATWHFGGLWRDEVNSVGIDSLPSFGSVWNDLQYDSFPILWHSTLRAWLLLGFTSDASLRLFGFLIGVAVLGALWLHARAFGRTSPLIALVLLEFNPTILRWGDTIRGHGLGLFFSIGIPGAIWLVLQRPGARSFFVALGLCLLAVQSQFYNAVLLLAAAAGGTGVALWHRNYRAIGWIGAVGILCALSLLPYLPAIHQAGAWNILVKVPDFPLSLFVGKLLEAAGSPWEVVLWLVTFVAGVAATVIAYCRKPHDARRDQQVFFLVGLVVCFIGYIAFLKVLSYGTNSWYYIPLLGFSALALDGMIGSTLKSWVFFRLSVGVILPAITLVPLYIDLEEQLTNVDLIAAKVQASVAPGDLVLVISWEPSVSFRRYYHGPAPWTTVPPLPSSPFHRYDAMKEDMMLPNPSDAVKPLLERIGATLRAGGRVWLVGNTLFVPPGQRPFVLPPAPEGPSGWLVGAYAAMWSEDVAYFLQTHAIGAKMIDVSSNRRISDFENLPLLVVSGWRG